MDVLNQRGRSEREKGKGEGEKDPPLSEVTDSRSLHFSSSGESAVHTNIQLIFCRLSVLCSHVFPNTPNRTRKEE